MEHGQCFAIRILIYDFKQKVQRTSPPLIAFLLSASIVGSYKKEHGIFKEFDNTNIFCIILIPKGKHKTD